MTYNRSEIMTAAWIVVRQLKGNGEPHRQLMARALRSAWFSAKMEASVLNATAQATKEREAEEKTAAALTEKRELIESAGGRFASVVFTKKDGSRRQMRVQPAKLKYHVKGDAASEPAQRAVETRKARHPNLLPVWDVEASAPRSVNLATVSRIAVNGAVHEFRI